MTLPSSADSFLSRSPSVVSHRATRKTSWNRVGQRVYRETREYQRPGAIGSGTTRRWTQARPSWNRGIGGRNAAGNRTTSEPPAPERKPAKHDRSGWTRTRNPRCRPTNAPALPSSSFEVRNPLVGLTTLAHEKALVLKAVFPGRDARTWEGTLPRALSQQMSGNQPNSSPHSGQRPSLNDSPAAPPRRCRR